jgi:sirohydrochlorin ferrochelatase
MTADDTTTGILIFAHGSSVEAANQGVRDLARRIQDAGPHPYVRAAFLDQAQPDLSAAVSQAAETGIRRVIVIPYFLTVGIHLQRDLPSLVAAQKAKHPDLEIEVGQSLEDHPSMPSLILERVREVVPKVAR